MSTTLPLHRLRPYKVRSDQWPEKLLPELALRGEDRTWALKIGCLCPGCNYDEVVLHVVNSDHTTGQRFKLSCPSPFCDEETAWVPTSKKAISLWRMMCLLDKAR